MSFWPYNDITFCGSSSNTNTYTISNNTQTISQDCGTFSDQTVYGTANIWVPYMPYTDPNLFSPNYYPSNPTMSIPDNEMNYPTPPSIPEEAKLKARELLKEFIGEQQVQALEEGHFIELEADQNHKYRIQKSENPGEGGSRQWKLMSDGTWKRFCIVSEDRLLPWGDQLVNKIAPLLSDPENSERVANWFDD